MPTHQILINGKFCSGRVTGVERYALDLVSAVDALCEDIKIGLIVPPGSLVPKLNNIGVGVLGKGSGMLWEQTYFQRYACKKKAKTISLTNTTPLLTGSTIGAIHDLRPIIHPYKAVGARAKAEQLYLSTCMRNIAKRSQHVLTISEQSKKEICEYLDVEERRVMVVNVSWEHMNDVEPSSEALAKYGLKEAEYFFSLGSVLPHKNIAWVIRAAENNPDQRFVLGGAVGSRVPLVPKNVLLLGYIPDSEIKALMGSCRAFLMPSLYEGFGVPPLEAVASGCRCLILSDIPVFHEVYGDCANYVDPHSDTWSWSDEMFFMSDRQAEGLLNRYRISVAAQSFLDLIQSLSD